MTEKAPDIFALPKRSRGLATRIPTNGKGLATMHSFLFDQLGDRDPRILVVDAMRLEAHNAGQSEPKGAYNPRFIDFLRGLKGTRDDAFRCVALDTEREHGTESGKFKGSLYINMGKGEEVHNNSDTRMLHVLAKDLLKGAPNIIWMLMNPRHEGTLPEQYARLVKYLCDDVLDHEGLLIRPNFPDEEGVPDDFKKALPKNRASWADRRVTFGPVHDLTLFKKPKKPGKIPLTPDQITYLASRLDKDERLLEALVEALKKRPELLRSLFQAGFENAGVVLMEGLLKDPAVIQMLVGALSSPIAEAMNEYSA